MTMKPETKKIYLDYAATTPIDGAVFRAMKPYFMEKFGNPGSLHSFGQEAIAAVDRSRETIAKAIGADFREIIFTSSATEANNLALRGTVRRFWAEIMEKYGKQLPAGIKTPHIITTAIEHESILETLRDMEARGAARVDVLPVNHEGRIDPASIKQRLSEETVLVSMMYANNEIGVIEPVKEIAAIVKSFRGKEKFPLVHTDAAQAFQYLDCGVRGLGIDLMTLSAHKIYGPKGVGALFIRNREQETRNKEGKSLFHVSGSLSPLLTGGGQEFGLRSGTENVPAIVGFAKAVELLFSNSQELENKKIAALRERLWKGIQKACPGAELNGISGEGIQNPKSKIQNPFLPNILNVYFRGNPAQDLLTKFDLNGLAVSSGSACRSRALESSYVIEALSQGQGTGNKKQGRERAHSSLRFSLGRPTTKQEIDAALQIIKRAL